jgi:hypothetical protein
MAWEWVGTTTLGVAGIVGTWLVGKQGRDATRVDAKEARKQQRLETTYVPLLEMAERTGQWVQMAYPMIDTNPPQPNPAELPSFAEQAHTEAVARAFGSVEVRNRMKTWRAVVTEMIRTVEQIGREEASGRFSEVSPRVTLDKLRPQEREARDAIADQVAGELGHRTTD